MKKITTIIAPFTIAVCAFAAGNGYTILTAETSAPRDGDNLGKQEIQPIAVKQKGDSMVWDLTNHKPGKPQLIRYRTAKDGQTIIESEPRSNKYYRLRGDTLLLTRQAQAGMSVTYQIPEPTISYPMQYGGSIRGYFYGEGNLGNITYLRNAGHSSTTIDSRGTLITPEGDTIKNVIRSHYIRTGTTHIDDNFLRSFINTRDSSLFSSDSIRHWLATDSVIHSIERWQWHAPGYRYPIAEAEKYKIYYYGTPADSVNRYYYYRAVDQEYDLGFDYANEAIRYFNETQPQYTDNTFINPKHRSQGNNGNFPPSNDITGKTDNTRRNISGNSDGNSSGNLASGTDIGINRYPYCNVYPTLVTNSTTINYGTSMPAEVTINLHSTAGGIVWKYKKTSGPGDYIVICPAETLPSGDYIIVTSIGKEIFTSKIIKK